MSSRRFERLAMLMEVNIDLDRMTTNPAMRLMQSANESGTKNNPIFSTSNDKRGGGGNWNGGPSHKEKGNL